MLLGFLIHCLMKGLSECLGVEFDLTVDQRRQNTTCHIKTRGSHLYVPGRRGSKLD